MPHMRAIIINAKNVISKFTRGDVVSEPVLVEK